MTQPESAIRMPGRAAIVTGGYTALGKAIALGFARAGADLGLIARTREKLDEACREIRALGVKAVPLVADITSEPQVAAAFQQAKSELGRIDVLVNNTGIPGALTKVQDTDLAEWRRILETNLTGAMLCCREAVRHMVPQGGGTIVNIGSTAGKKGVPFAAAYSASKWGLLGLTQTLAQEAGRDNIRVNYIALGSAEGPRTDWQIQRRAKARGATVEELTVQRMGGSALGRFVTQPELATTVLYLASDLSGGITGQCINLDAGVIFH